MLRLAPERSGGRPARYGLSGTTGDYAKEANRQTLVCLMLEEVEAIENLPELVTVPGVDVYFIGSGDLSQSLGYSGQQTHLEVQKMMERGVKTSPRPGALPGAAAPTIICSGSGMCTLSGRGRKCAMLRLPPHWATYGT
jgi:2-keto-3-deoxy-L-rhamnonate aldolase RhmA